jgi:dTDP-4-dehydrorhamnose 3,5-epimerase
MDIIPTELEGVKVLRPRIFTDLRGTFVKTFHAPTLREAGLDFTPQEEFFSISHRNVVRGMHFQLPPADHVKVVYCLTGRVLDVVVDLRKKSPTFGRHLTRELSGHNREILYIPTGFAHGFLTLEDDTTMLYQTSTAHSPAHDTGIRWDSIGFDWPAANPIMSDRDRQFPALGDFKSPF